MTRILSLRVAAAFFIFSVFCSATIPAYAAGPVPVATPTESAYAAVLRTINPKLPVEKALAYARSLSPNHLVAVSVVSDEGDQEKLERLWEEYGIEVPLEIVYSPYRELTRPILRYVDELDARWENDIITVLLPEFVVRHWWGNILHNQTALLLKGRLLFRKGTVVTSLPYHLD